MNKFLLLATLMLSQSTFANWFEELKTNGSKEDLYRVLYAMPKGGDLHNHLSGSVYSEWWYELALAQKDRGYRYYTKVRIENCIEYGNDEFGGPAYFLMFRNITERMYNRMDDCGKREYKRLEDLDERELAGWHNSLRLDKPHEGREEFFSTHWQRLYVLTDNPYLQAEYLYRNMQAFGEEGLSYLEAQVGVRGFRDADGNVFTPAETIQILLDRIAQKDAQETGVTVRFQISLLRFRPNAEAQLKEIYQIVHDNQPMFVGVNMVGREDNDKGHPLRFLDTLRDLRREMSGVRLSIHAGEVDEPNYHVRDTLLLGADRIGHGLNLITDDDTMRLMRHGPYLVEINLISNLLLNYVSDYAQHPFPEYLRTGIPVALSTDDRGMWDSTITDEFFVGVTEFNLTWQEIKTLSRNSLEHAFVEADIKAELVREFDEKMVDFEREMSRNGVANLDAMPETRRFICTRYEICNE